MNLRSFFRSLPGFSVPLWLAVAAVCGALAARGAAPAPSAKPATNAPPAVVEIPKSMFVDDFKNKSAKDPFFPGSIRRDPVPPKPIVPTAGSTIGPGGVVVIPLPPPPPPPPPKASEFISLKGVLGGARPLAMINTTIKSYDIEAGEQISVKVPEATKLPDARVKIKCVEIKTDSIVIEIEGESGRHELRLPRRI